MWLSLKAAAFRQGKSQPVWNQVCDEGSCRDRGEYITCKTCEEHLRKWNGLEGGLLECLMFACVCIPHWCWIALKWYKYSSFLEDLRCIKQHFHVVQWRAGCGISEISGRFSWLSVCLQQGGWEEGKLEQLPPPDWQLVWKWLVHGQDWEPSKISQDPILAENGCLCGQLLLKLAEKFLEMFSLGCIFRGTTLSRKLIAAGQCQKCPNTETRIYLS